MTLEQRIENLEKELEGMKKLNELNSRGWSLIKDGVYTTYNGDGSIRLQVGKIHIEDAEITGEITAAMSQTADEIKILNKEGQITALLLRI